MVNDSTFTFNILQNFWIGIYHLIYKNKRNPALWLDSASHAPSIEYINMVDPQGSPHFRAVHLRG